MTPDWPHQIREQELVERAIAAGHKRICVACPTGGGKTRMLVRKAELALRHNRGFNLLTNRKLLVEQASADFTELGIRHGIRASEYEPELLQDVQISSIQTENKRVFDQGKWEMHNSWILAIDECHNQTGDVVKKIIDQHVEKGGIAIGYTATPLDLDGIYEHLIVAATNRELRECGALLPATHFHCSEPDTRKVKMPRKADGEFEYKTVKKLMNPAVMIGNIVEHWREQNPEELATIGFAPGVPESIYLCDLCNREGIRSAHIDGETVYVDGQEISSSKNAREDVLGQVRDGQIKILWNRFVLREGVNVREFYCCIMATMFGSLTSYLQSGGRLLRSHPSMDHVVVLDHGGNWWRHGSLNANRHWELGQTASRLAATRDDLIRERKVNEGIVCHNCGAVRMHGPVCHNCGYEGELRRRKVMQTDGTLTEIDGPVLKERKRLKRHDTTDKWVRQFWRANNSKSGMTFLQAEALFFLDHHYYPPRDLPFMPVKAVDWMLPVKDVPKSNLIQKESVCQ